MCSASRLSAEDDRELDAPDTHTIDSSELSSDVEASVDELEGDLLLLRPRQERRRWRIGELFLLDLSFDRSPALDEDERFCRPSADGWLIFFNVGGPFFSFSASTSLACEVAFAACSFGVGSGRVGELIPNGA